MSNSFYLLELSFLFFCFTSKEAARRRLEVYLIYRWLSSLKERMAQPFRIIVKSLKPPERIGYLVAYFTSSDQVPQMTLLLGKDLHPRLVCFIGNQPFSLSSHVEFITMELDNIYEKPVRTLTKIIGRHYNHLTPCN